MKQTAVEWLINELGLDNHLMGSCEEELNKAKEMEKQQIVDAYHKGQLCVLHIVEGSLIPMGFNSTSDKEDKEDAIKYYNETFKSE